MNAVATQEQPLPAKVAKAQIASGGRIAAIVPQDIDQTFRLAGAIAMSQMAPKSYSNDERKIFVGILAGMEIGLTPMAALQSIAVIGNMPAIWGDGALALVQASDLLEDFEESDDGHTATCRAVRKGIPTPIIKTFSMDDAKQAGLSGKVGPWTQYPKRMRQMRARLLVLRDGFSDILKGIRIAEEVRDYPPEAFADDTPVAPRLTRSALENHAEGVDGAVDAEIEPVVETEPEQGRTDEQHGDQHDCTELDNDDPRAAMIDSAQISDLQGMIEGFGLNLGKILAHYKIKQLTHIPAEEFANVKRQLNLWNDMKIKQESEKA